MPSKRLTDAFVRNAKCSAVQRQVVFFDRLDRGVTLQLVVSYGGTRTFRAMTYADNGRSQSRKLGSYPAMTLAQAKKAARTYFEDPRKFEVQAETGSFHEIAENWFKRHVQGNKLRSQRDIRRQLESYVYPNWKHRKFLEIRRHEVNALLDAVADNHGRAQADAVLATLRSIMGWHQARDEHYVSPIVRGMKRNKPKARKRILTDDELRAVWNASLDAGMFGAMVRFLLLTGQRREKTATMEWADLEHGTWNIASEEREKGTAGNLRLSKLAASLLESLPHLSGNPYVFVGRLKNPFSGFSKAKARLDAESGVKDWVLHDLRRTARSLMSRAGVRPDISERVLGHAIVGVEGVYDRHHYESEKADALERLAQLITTILKPPAGNVIALNKRKG